MERVNFVFTKEEEQYISETLNIILDDFEKIAGLLEIPYHCIEIENLTLQFNPKNISLNSKRRSYSCYLSEVKDKKTTYSSETTKSKRKSFENFEKSEQQDIVFFLANYEKFRSIAIEKVKEVAQNKKSLFEQLQAIRNKYSTEISVDFGTVATQNIKTLEVTTENGRNVGTIDFGNRIVKVISNGDIVLKKLEPIQEKVKQK